MYLKNRARLKPDTKFWLSFFLLATVAYSSITIANDPAPAHGEAPPAGGAPASVAVKSEWKDVETEVLGLEAQVRALTSSIEKSLEEKNHLNENTKAYSDVVKKISKDHKELKQVTDEYERKRVYLDFRYPQRKKQSSEVFKHIEVKAVDQMEQSLTLEGRLKKTKKLIDKQYPDDSKAASEESHTPPTH